MKGMEKIAVAKEKANHFCASLENATGLGVGTKSEAADRLKHPQARFPAYLRAGVEYPRNRPDAYAGGSRYITNRGFCWNCFHLACALFAKGVLLRFAEAPSPTVPPAG